MTCFYQHDGTMSRLLLLLWFILCVINWLFFCETALLFNFYTCADTENSESTTGFKQLLTIENWSVCKQGEAAFWF